MPHNPNQGHPVPDPAVIAKRIAARGRDPQINPGRRFGRRSHLRHELSYSLYEQAFSLAALRSSLFAAADGPEARPSSTHDYLIGSYDSGQERWRFYPEYVKPDESPGLSHVFENLALHSYANFVPKGIFADGRHPLTVRARGETGALLAGTGIAERLIADPNIGHVSAHMDEASVVFMTMSPRLDEAQYPGVGRFLSVCFANVINRQRERVSGIGISIASCTAATGDVWAPTEGIITADEWEGLKLGPQILLECEATDRDFYAGSACVVYRYDTPSGGLAGAFR